MLREQRRGGIVGFVVQNGLSLITVTCGAAVLVADGVVNLSPTAIAKMTLAVLCLLATSEIIEKSRRLRSIEDQVTSGFDDIARRIGKDDVVRFKSGEDAHAYIARAIEGATHCIYHAAIGPGLERMRPESKTEQYAATESKLRGSDITYKYITAFVDAARLDRVQRWVEDAAIRRFYVAHYPIDRCLAPTIYFMTFDESKVVARVPRPAGEPDEYVLITDPAMVGFFVDYHRYLWQQAELVNDGTSYKPSLLTTARQRLAQTQRRGGLTSR